LKYCGAAKRREKRLDMPCHTGKRRTEGKKGKGRKGKRES
jgi:hypothetical protein